MYYLRDAFSQRECGERSGLLVLPHLLGLRKIMSICWLE